MTDWTYFSKRPEFDNFRMMDGLDESVQDWKEYFWKVTIDATETRFDFHSSWSRLIHKGELPYRLLRLNDKATVSKIQKFVPEYIRRYGHEYNEFDSEEIIRRYLNNEFIFELPAVITHAEGSSADIPNYNQNRP